MAFEVKRSKAMECEIDILSVLGDDILTCNIFSHLSLRDALRTSVLSSRWRFLWKQILHLDFCKHFFRTLNLSCQSWSCDEKVKYINDAIDNILLLHSGDIERFSIHPCSIETEVFEKLRIEQWVHHAALKQVKHMSLKMSDIPPFCFDIPLSLFSCHLLRDLELESFWFTEIPTEFGGFRSLQSCYLLNVTIDALEQLIGLCPLLHKLVLEYCWRLINLKIQAPNLNSLNIINCFDLKSLAVDCPELIELEIVNCYNLIEFKIYSCVSFHQLHASDVQIHPMQNSLRKLSIGSFPKFLDLNLPSILGCFYNLEEVHIQMSRWKTYEKDHSEQERAKGEVVADLTFPSLKTASIHFSLAIKKEEAVMLPFLLKHAPSLNVITVILPYHRANVYDKEFIRKVLDLQQIYERVDIKMMIDEKYVDPSCLLSDTNS